MRPKKANYISGEGFRGNAELCLADLKKLSVEGFAPNLLSNLLEAWTGGVAGFIGLTLSNDNRRVNEAKFGLIGSLCKEKRVSANRFWELDAQTSLTFSVPDCSVFSFPNGSMVSDLVDGSTFPHRFQVGDEVLDPQTLPAPLLGFSFKCAVVPTRDTYAKVTLLLFPLPKNTLLTTHPFCTNPQFPGISLFRGEFPLTPNSLDPPLEKNWGFPFAPAVLPGADFEVLENFPSTDSIKAAMAQVLRKAVRPECKQGFQTLQPRWNEISTGGPSRLKDSPLELIWPPPSGKNSVATEGRPLFQP